MFLENEPKKNIEDYKDTLTAVGAISNLFSNSEVPYLSYRATENIFCKCLEAENLSRSDCSADAAKNGVGFGIKTFINGNGKSFQKVAEFNSKSDLYKGKTPKDLIETVATLRNERINATKRIHGLKDIIYHCVVREAKKVIVFECPMDEIDIQNIKSIKITSKNTISFEDGRNEYSFNTSKSTLYKRFITENEVLTIDIDIIEDPYELLKNNIAKKNIIFEKEFSDKEYIYLPLFSDRGARNVPERSGLNQWNARGRVRHFNEIYIPIPAIIHQKRGGFFPKRDEVFELLLPNGKSLSTKVCQDGSKALMSNPNLDLGKWLLRDVMNLNNGELLTYEMLEDINIDSVIIYKEAKGKYSINFAEVGSYDKFIENIE